MPDRSINELAPAEKTQIALECILLETAGNSKASEHLATKYSVSKRGVNQLKNAALKAIKDAFSPAPEVPTSGLLTIDADALSRNISSLIGSPAAAKSSPKSAPVVEEDDSDESEEPIHVEEVYNAIVEWNEGGNRPLIYISAGMLEKISDSSKSEVQKWVSAHQAEIKEHNALHKLTKETNVGKEMRALSVDDLRDKLGLLDN